MRRGGRHPPGRRVGAWLAAGPVQHPVRHPAGGRPAARGCRGGAGALAGRRWHREATAVTGYSWALAAGLALLGAAALLDLTAGARRERRERGREREAREAWLRAAPYLLGAAASACLAVTGAGALAGRAVRVGGAAGAGGGAPATTAGGLLGAGHGWLLGAGTGGLAADRLSGLFLLIAFGAATMVSLAFASWAAHTGPVRRGLGAGYALCLGAVAVVLIATDAFTLLFAWESVTVAFYLLAGFDRDRSGRPAAALVTFAFGKVSG